MQQEELIQSQPIMHNQEHHKTEHQQVQPVTTQELQVTQLHHKRSLDQQPVIGKKS